VRRHFIILAILATSGLAYATGASARTVCQGPAPAAGQVVHGPVLEVPDAATLCLATGASPAQWTAIAVPQLKASRALLMAAAFGQNATCVIGADGQADCKIEGVALADQIRQPEIQKASMQWRTGREDLNVRTQIASAAR